MPNRDRIGFSRLDAADLAGLEERTGLVWRGGEALRDLGRTLRQSGGIPKAVVPASFLATLRPYQGQGVDWLQFLASAGLGGVLADDMGLGKTVQTLAHLMIEKAAGRLDRPSLIVCPTSLIPNWTAEARRFAPGPVGAGAAWRGAQGQLLQDPEARSGAVHLSAADAATTRSCCSRNGMR